MKKLIIALIAISSFSLFASECNIKIERNGTATDDIRYKNEVITKKGENFGFIRHYNEDLNLQECIDFANKEATWITNHHSVSSGISKISISHEDLSDGVLSFEMKANS